MPRPVDNSIRRTVLPEWAETDRQAEVHGHPAGKLRWGAELHKPTLPPARRTPRRAFSFVDGIVDQTGRRAKRPPNIGVSQRSGGRGGIRTHEGLAPLAVFKTAALNHSATLPCSKLNNLHRTDLPTETELAPNWHRRRNVLFSPCAVYLPRGLLEQGDDFLICEAGRT